MFGIKSMFGGKRASMVPAGPHEITAEIEIECPVGAVYPLIDLGSPRSSYRQLADQMGAELVEAGAGQARRFELISSMIPDAMFTFTVTHEVPNSEYAYFCESDALRPVIRSHEHFVLHPTKGDSCRLVLTHTVTFDGPLEQEAFEMEAIELAHAGFSSLSKIKLHAEEGDEAARSLRAAQVAALDESSSDPD
jgi:hypothetical protein